MVVNNFVGPVVERFLLVSNIFASVKIDQLIVPETVADGDNVTLECLYSGASDDVVVRWLFNGTQVYEWSPKIEPRVNGILRGKIDISYRHFDKLLNTRHHYLMLLNLSSELSGDYTCDVQSRGQEAYQTKTMIVYNTERDFRLTINKTRIHCTASGLYPQPHLTIEFNRFPVAQQQRIWRNGSLFDAECTATMIPSKQGEVACRLQIPQVDYTAIVKKYISAENSGANQKTSTSSAKIITAYIILFIYAHAINPL